MPVPVEAEEAAVPVRPQGRATIVGLVIGVPVSTVLLALAVRGLNTDDVANALRAASLRPLVAAFVAMMTVYVVQALRWRYIARHFGHLRRRSALTYVVGGVAISNVVRGRPGDLVRAHWLGRALAIRRAHALSTVIVDRSGDVLALITMLVLTYQFVPHPAWMRNLAIAAVGFGIIVAAGLYGCRWYVDRRLRSGRGLPERMRAVWAVRQLALVVRGTARTVSARDVLVIWIASLAAWSVWGLAAFLTADSLSLHLTLVQTVFITSVINLGVSIPSSPGFIGTYQWLGVATLGLFSVDHNDAFAFSLLLHALWLVPTTAAGVALAVYARRPRRRWSSGMVGEPAP